MVKSSGRSPVAGSTVTFTRRATGAPKQLGQSRLATMALQVGPGDRRSRRQSVLYLVAKGGNPRRPEASGDNDALALLAVVGSKPPPTS